MITYINESNSSKYTVLFDKAERALNLTDEITTLEEYFAHIKELSKLDKKYTILPLDEEVFEINANTRQITVPPTFKKHGVGVQGDQVAEIVYFRVDRFFDAMDLNETEIYIQWETAPDSKGVVSKGLSKEYVRDIESDPGNIIFGWPISSEITEHPGNVKFSVRFFKWIDANDHEAGLSYSLGTLTSSVLINPALDFDFDMEYVANVNDMIVDRLTNSDVVGGDPVGAPVYTLNLVSPKNLDKETGKLLLKVQAWSPDAGAITYYWTYQSLDGKTTREVVEIPVFEPTQDTEPNSQKIYYVQDSELPLGYRSYDWTGEESEAELPELFEKFSTFEAESVGKFFAVATNTKGHKTEELHSEICEVPMPVVPVITSKLPERAILDDDDAPSEETIGVTATVSDLGDIHYEWYKNGNKLEGVIGATNSFNEEGIYEVVVVNSLNKEQSAATKADAGSCRITFSAKTPVFVGEFTEQKVKLGSTLGVQLNPSIASDYYSYQWFVQKFDADMNVSKTAIVGATNATYVPTEKNNYLVEVTNHVNGTVSAPAVSGVFDVID